MQPLGQLLRNVIAQRIGDDDKRSRILPAHMFRVEPFLTRHNRQRGFQRLPRQQRRPADAQRREVAVFIQPFRRLHLDDPALSRVLERGYAAADFGWGKQGMELLLRASG